MEIGWLNRYYANLTSEHIDQLNAKARGYARSYRQGAAEAWGRDEAIAALCRYDDRMQREAAKPRSRVKAPRK